MRFFLFLLKNADRDIKKNNLGLLISLVKVNIPALHPHALRHSFATHHLSAGSSLAEIKQSRASSYNTTLIYAEIPTEELRESASVTSPPPNGTKIILVLVPSSLEQLINVDFTESYFTVGRNSELQQLNQNINRNINTLVGSISVKTHFKEHYDR
jgi:hypothetical protein